MGIKMGKKSNRLRLKGQSYMYMQMSKIISEQMKGLNYGDMQEAVKLYDELKDFERVVDRSDYFEDYWSISYPSLTRPNDLPPEPLNEESLNKHFSRSQSHVSDRSRTLIV